MPFYSCFNCNMNDCSHQSDQKNFHQKKRKGSALDFHDKRKHRRLSSSSSSSSSYIQQKSSKHQFNDGKLFCDDCNKFYENICPYHQQIYIPDRKISQLLIKYSQPKADLTCPDGIVIKLSTISKAGKGVFARKRFEKNTFFGPYIGIRHSNFQSAQESGYSWSIADRHGKMVYIIDGYDPNNSNWMRYINCPNTVEQQNLQPVQYDRNMFYKTMRTIHPGEELFVYYGDDYARFLGIQPFNIDSIPITSFNNSKTND